jgi:hypothetical protein
MIINNHTHKITWISHGSPKRWATSTKHRHRLSYYSDHGDYIRLAIFHHVSHTQSFASTGLHEFIHSHKKLIIKCNPYPYSNLVYLIVTNAK